MNLLPRTLTRDVLTVLLMSGLVLFAASRVLDVSTIHLNGMGMSLNDQLGYISVARNLAFRGKFENSVVYPALLTQDNLERPFYMPGYYVLLAGSFLLFGNGTWPALLPSLLSYVLSALGVYLIGLRLYDRRIGLLAAFLFCIFPANLLFSYVAMIEMTAVATVVIALAIFVFLPLSVRPIAGPFLILIPLLVRETNVVILIPMAVMIARSHGLRTAVLSTCLSLALAVATLLSPLSTGRPSLGIQNFVLRNITLYNDAYATAQLKLGILDWSAALWRNTRENLVMLVTGTGDVFVDSTHRILCGFSIVALIGGILHFRKDVFPLTVGLVALGMLIVLLPLHYFDSRSTRLLLPVWSLLSILASSLVYQGKLGKPHLRRIVIAVACACAVSSAIVAEVRERFSEGDGWVDSDTAFLENLHHDDRTLLVGPYWLTVGYGYKHSTVKWAFEPANRETLRLLAMRYAIGTMVVPRPPSSDVKLDFDDITSVGLHLESRFAYGNMIFWVFRGPDSL